MAEQKLKWGVISTAKIGWEKVIPGIQLSGKNEILAIGSENFEKAKQIAADHGIGKVHTSYDDLINDSEIDVIYNPLPNNMHVEWSIKALQAGKHVLCEKPIALSAEETQVLIDEVKKYPKLKLMEAFMYKFHPQWLKVRELVKSSVIGEVRTVNTFFSYYNVDSNNIRNRTDVGGGTLMDIGCYAISFPKFIFGSEPLKVSSIMEKDPNMGTDRMTSALLSFDNGRTATFTCSTQLTKYQRCIAYGANGYIEVEIPCNAPPNEPCRVTLKTNDKEESFLLGPADQYTLESDAFADFIHNDTDMTAYLDDAIGNMKTIDAVVKSASEGKWVDI